MCGIVGIVESDLEPAGRGRRSRSAWCGRCIHRGPDEEGSVTLPGVGLGMRRLAIVDLAGGQQPFTNETGDIQIVANGEIYNFRELQQRARGRTATRSARATPTSRSWSTPTSSGARTSCARLRGMFALAIWDGRTRTLIAARDRAGEKPLYWTQTRRRACCSRRK